MAEFDLIERFRRAAGDADRETVLGIGDDAAILDIPQGRQLVATTDTLNSGVHFPDNAMAADIGHKALAVNLSDLAAMGAEPRWVLLSLSMPRGDMDFADGLIEGFMSLAREVPVSLVGGDTCSGPLSVTVTALGLAPAGGALQRSGARDGDLVVVSGVPGLAGFGLRQIGEGLEPGPDLIQALHRPIPRVALGAALVGKASACIDISDGLLADLGHIVEASGCGAEIRLDRLPRHQSLEGLGEPDRWRLQLTGGDDYELCFTLPERHAELLDDLAVTGGAGLTVIGWMRGGPEIRCLAPDGGSFEAGSAGYEHFT